MRRKTVALAVLTTIALLLVGLVERRTRPRLPDGSED